MKLKEILLSLAAIVLCAAILFGCFLALEGVREENAHREHLRIMQTLLPGSESFTLEPYTGEDPLITSVHKAENGFVVQTLVTGYASDITMLVGVSNEGKVTGLVVRRAHETPGLGSNVLTDTDFLAQFLNSTGDTEIGTNVDGISGATVTSRAISRSVNSAVAVVTGADVSSGATE